MDQSNAVTVIPEVGGKSARMAKRIQRRGGALEASDPENLLHHQRTFRTWPLPRELQTVLMSLGKTEKKELGTIAGALHRAWIDTKVGLGAGDKSILELVEKGEARGQRYLSREAIGSPLPPDAADIVSRQARSIQTAHDQVKALRDGLAA